ncbi:hypothetical protein GOBAR_AA07902 [Gossypium barbadense]|uniref:BED-type domain-containing protein n=1 Tax=Gossypium barbadense TaxID=3634 RepID=A0A2P5YB01_GOSBA|nr:hypothetical protein GOBAR_AA07902 [Gossypium barbadense]
MASSNSPIPVDDGFNKYESAPKRQKSTTSKVWDEMTKLECDDKNKLKAQCNHCKTIFSAKPSSGTSHLRRHLNSCLKKANKDITQYTIATQPSLGGVWKVHKVLLGTVKGPYSFLTPMVKQMQEKFNKYWAEYSLILSCAAILDPRYKLNYVQYCFTTIYGIHASDFVETILSNLRLLFDEYVKKSKSMFSYLAGSSNVSNKNPVDSSLDEHNVNSVDFGGDFDESDDYKRYLNESSTMSEKAQLDIYLEESALELNSQIDVLDYWKIGFKNDDDDEGDEDDVSSIAF